MFKIYCCLILLNIVFVKLAFLRVKHNQRLKESIVNRPSDKSHDDKFMFKARFWSLSIIPIFHIFTLFLFAYVFVADEDSVIKLFKRCN